MKHAKYFEQGQKIRLLIFHADQASGEFEALTGYVEDCSQQHIDISLPYGGTEEEAYPFTEGMELEILTETLGLGLRLSGTFEQSLENSIVRVKVSHDLTAFQHRLKQRADGTVGLRFSKSKGNLRTLRERWHKNVAVLGSGRDLSNLKAFTECEANLSSGGIRFTVKQPVDSADIFLLLMELKDGKPPICTLAETVWISKEMADEGMMVGMQFIAIIAEDQARIDAYVRKQEAAASTVRSSDR